ncbi:MAG TPA: hypothetical protein VD931_04940 [Baekduia sp.]|nr:hypothetical protein [Baekduia sp.]
MACLRSSFIAAAAAAAALPATAAADTALAPAPGGQNLTTVLGWAVWVQPGDDGAWRLVVRSPGGEVRTPGIPSFAVPVDPSGGTDIAGGLRKRVTAVYPRCEGRSTRRGCDIHELDLETGTERKLDRLATSQYSETAVARSGGTFAVVRRGGARPGLTAITRTRTRRISRALPYEVAVNQSRVASIERGGIATRRIVIRRLSGEGPTVDVARGLAANVRHLVATRYRYGYTTFDGERTNFWMTGRISGRATSARVREGSRTFDGAVAGAELLPGNDQTFGLVLDGRFLGRLEPPVTFRF